MRLPVAHTPQFVPPGELVEGIQMPQESGFSRLLGAGRDFPLDRYEVDLNDPTPFDRQLFDQVGKGHGRMGCALCSHSHGSVCSAEGYATSLR